MAIGKKERKNPSRPSPPAIGPRRTPNRPRFTTSSLLRRLSNGRLTKRSKDRTRKTQRGTLPKSTIHALPWQGSRSRGLRFPIGNIFVESTQRNRGWCVLSRLNLPMHRKCRNPRKRQSEEAKGLWRRPMGCQIMLVAAIGHLPDYGGRKDVTEVKHRQVKGKVRGCYRGCSSKSKRERASDELFCFRLNPKGSGKGDWSLKIRVCGFPLLQVMGYASLREVLKASDWWGVGVAMPFVEKWSKCRFVPCNFIRRSDVGVGDGALAHQQLVEVYGISGPRSRMEKCVCVMLVMLCKLLMCNGMEYSSKENHEWLFPQMPSSIQV